MKNLKNIIWEPSVLFNTLKEKPNWFLPFLIIIIIGIITAIILHPIQMNLIIAKLSGNIPEENVNFMIKQANKSKYIGYSLIPLFTLLKLAIVSGLLLLGSYLFSDKMKFKQMFSIVCWSNIILTLGGILNVFIIYLKGIDTINDPTDLATMGLNIFFNAKSIGVVLNALLSEISVFSIWYIALISIGLVFVGEISKVKAIFISVFVWLIITGFKVGIVVIGSRFST